MRIGVLTHNYPRYTGDFMGHFVQSLCNELAKPGNQVTVIAPFDAAFDRPMHTQIGAGTIDISLYRYAWTDQQHILGYGRSMEADLYLRRNTYMLSPLMLAAGTLATLKWAQRTHPHILHAHWTLPNGLMAALVGKILGIPIAVSVPGSDATIGDSNPLFRSLSQFTFDQAGLITANSQSLRDVAVTRLGADLAKFDLIEYGVDPNAKTPDPTGTAELRAQLGIPQDALVLLAVGRMVYKKGFDYLIKALALLAGLPVEHPLPPIHTVMIGEGDLWLEWQKMAQEMGLAQQMHWVGNVLTDRIGVYNNMADIAIMPAVTRPATGAAVSVLDAMSCAKPIIATDAAGNTLTVTHGVNGLIVPEQDPLALAQAIVYLADKPALRTEMGLAGRRRVETDLGWPVLAGRYLAHFEELTKNATQA